MRYRVPTVWPGASAEAEKPTGETPVRANADTSIGASLGDWIFVWAASEGGPVTRFRSAITVLAASSIGEVASRLAHSLQKRDFSGFSVPQRGQSICLTPSL